MQKTIVFLVLLFSVNFIYSENVIVRGVAVDYSGTTLKLMKYSDLITFTEIEISSAIVQENGKFEFNFSLTETTSAFIYLEIFKGFIVIEPGKTYEIIIPERILKTAEDELNPYFKEQEFYFTLQNDSVNELNANLLKFDSLYNKALIEIFKTSYHKYKKSKVDSLLKIIDQKFEDYDNEYFENYKEYRYATIRKAAYLRDKELAVEKYFEGQEIQYNNPAYMGFFSEIFDDVFSSSSYLIDWDNVRLSIAKKSLYGINQTLSISDLYKEKNFRHLVIIKGLYDMFYSDSADKESVLAILDSMQSVVSVENKLIVDNFWKQATSLLLNYDAPVFELPDKDGNLVNLKDFNDNFVYLSFYHPDSYVCKRQVELLKVLNGYNADMLKIVTIFIGDSPEKMNEFIEENDCDWTFLYYDKNSKLIKDYQILVYPTYVLINPEGKLAQYPASSPEEEFEREFNGFYTEWKKELEKRKKENKLLGN